MGKVWFTTYCVSCHKTDVFLLDNRCMACCTNEAGRLGHPKQYDEDPPVFIPAKPQTMPEDKKKEKFECGGQSNTAHLAMVAMMMESIKKSKQETEIKPNPEAKTALGIPSASSRPDRDIPAMNLPN